MDHIKVMAGGGAMSPCDEIDTSQYSLEELEAVVFEAESVEVVDDLTFRIICKNSELPS